MTLTRRFKVWIVITALGPAVGAVALMLALMGLAAFSSSPSGLSPISLAGASLILVIFAVLFAYPIAGLPAALTGLLVAVLAGHIRSRSLFVVCSGLAGAATAAALAGLPTIREGAGAGWSATMAAIGGFAGLVSGFVAWRWARPQTAPATDQPATTLASPD